MKTATTILLWLALAVPALAEVSAVINGPTSGAAGDLVVLSGRDSVGNGFRWITPAGVQTIACGDGLDLAFASGRPGSYTFTLIAADTDAAIDYATHTVVIAGGGVIEPEPDPGPDDPTEPDPTPTPGQFAELAKQSQQLSTALGDPETAAGLAAAIRAADAEMERLCTSGRCPGLDAAKQMMVAAIENRLLQRVGRSRSVNWLDGWRKPINDALKQINSADVPTYRAAMRAVATGLE